MVEECEVGGVFDSCGWIFDVSEILIYIFLVDCINILFFFGRFIFGKLLMLISLR